MAERELMSLLDDVEAARRLPGPTCAVPLAIGQQAEPFRSELAAAITDRAVESKALSRVLRDKYAIDLTDYTIRRHRNGECRCR